jgi:cupin domain
VHNEHPGSEAILMLQGSVALYYEDGPGAAVSLSADAQRLCHFDSRYPHWVENVSDHEDAEVLVIRFYRDRLTHAKNDPRRSSAAASS